MVKYLEYFRQYLFDKGSPSKSDHKACTYLLTMETQHPDYSAGL